MQDRPLSISALLRHAAAFNGSREIVTAGYGPVRRYGFAELERRARALAAALGKWGLKPGDRAATLAWNSDRHLELFYAVTGMGAVLHTVNPRLWEEQIVYIVNHAEDRILFFDVDLVDVVRRLADRLPTVEKYVALCGPEDTAAIGDFSADCYAEFAYPHTDFDWPEFDELAASILCYTSGTTGMPKGVLGSHRSVVLHALYAQSAVAFGLTPFDSVLLVVPMFHAYGWSLPFVCAIAGAKLVLPGPAPQPRAIVDLMHAEGATLSTGVPTVWSGVFDHLDESGRTLGPLKRALIGGSAIPNAMSDRLRNRHGVEVVTGWGMTELSPLGSFTCRTPEIESLPRPARDAALYSRAGRILFPVEAKIVGSDGAPMPRDGSSSGELWVRGPCVASGYFREDGGPILDVDGWFPTGDIATIDVDGSISITDRRKDLIKSGGEWISSTDLEAAASRCSGVAQTAAIAARHPKWQERPILLVVAQAGVKLARDSILAEMAKTLARWQMPDDVVFVEALPLTATGKIDKKTLRERYKHHLFAESVQ